MLRTHLFHCSLPKLQADALNRESGCIYTSTMIEQYRIFHHTGHWLSAGAGEKINDSLSKTLLHAHSRDAAQQGFYRACKTAAACRKVGLDGRYPRKRKTYRTTIWKNTAIRKCGAVLLLSLARGNAPIQVVLPSNLALLPVENFTEMRLVWDPAARRYFWHLVVDDGLLPHDPPGESVAAIDLGEVHPAAATDGEEAVVFSARQMRALAQLTNKRLAEIQAKQARKSKGSRSWKQLQRRKNRFLAQQRRRRQDIEHKVSRSVVNWAVTRQVGTLAVGDVRDVADQVDTGQVNNQKISNWTHGRMRRYLTYKAEAEGIQVVLVNEAYTTQECPNCHGRYKPRGRVYRCPVCGFVSHRDAVGSANILSCFLFGELGCVQPSTIIKYRHPFDATGKRSPSDTGQVAWVFMTQEAAPL
jgi:putative transposase